MGSETIPVHDPDVDPDLIRTTVRVATWNLWWRFGPWERRRPLIVDEVRRVDADIVCVQEAWATDDDWVLAPACDALGYHGEFVSGREPEPGVRYGNAILSRWPIMDVEHRRLPALEGPDEGRVVLRAEIDGPRGTLQAFSTHLNWRFDQSHVRQAQVEAVAAFVQEQQPFAYPPIVCGDFNATAESDEIRTLTGRRPIVHDLVLVDAWRHVHPTDPGFTWNRENPYVAAQLQQTRRIDYVFAGWYGRRGAGDPVAAELMGTGSVDGIHPSDHYGVVAHLRY